MPTCFVIGPIGERNGQPALAIQRYWAVIRGRAKAAENNDYALFHVMAKGMEGRYGRSQTCRGFTRSKIFKEVFGGTNAIRGDFSGVAISFDFSGYNIRSDFSQTVLNGSTFRNCILDNINFEGLIGPGAIFLMQRLAGVIFLMSRMLTRQRTSTRLMRTDDP